VEAHHHHQRRDAAQVPYAAHRLHHPDHQLPDPDREAADLARFDGSLIVYRTAGQVSATCDNEAANLLTMNLMHEIVQGTRTAEEARQEFGEQTAAWLMNRPAPYTEAICFDLPDESETGYPDEPVMKGATIRQTVGKVKDALGLGDDT
jgi:hypothetical protein